LRFLEWYRNNSTDLRWGDNGFSNQYNYSNTLNTFDSSPPHCILFFCCEWGFLSTQSGIKLEQSLVWLHDWYHIKSQNAKQPNHCVFTADHTLFLWWALLWWLKHLQISYNTLIVLLKPQVTVMMWCLDTRNYDREPFILLVHNRTISRKKGIFYWRSRFTSSTSSSVTVAHTNERE